MVLVSQTELIEKAIAGEVISFPTDTVPALAVKPQLATLLYQVKQRPQSKPLILMGASLTDLLPYITGTEREFNLWKAIAKSYFPGAITLVLPASELVPPGMNPTNSQTIGIRVPNHPIAREILKQTGVLATTSANLSGQNTLVTTQDINLTFRQIAILEDLQPNQPQGSGLPSTVVQWSNSHWQILRQGSVNFSLPNATK